MAVINKVDILKTYKLSIFQITRDVSPDILLDDILEQVIIYYTYFIIYIYISYIIFIYNYK